MNVRKLFGFFRTPFGRLVAFLALFFLFVAGGIFHGNRWKKHPVQASPAQDVYSLGMPRTTHMRFVREIPAMPAPHPSPVPESVTPRFFPESPPLIREVSQAEPPPPVAMAIHREEKPGQGMGPMLPLYLPFGRLIRCELVNTVDTSNLLTPIIGLVMEDVWHGGQLVVPAGTEVHGSAGNKPERERVGSDSRWVLVFEDGREMALAGMALDHSQIPGSQQWEISDGSAGLRGALIQVDRYAEIKAVVAAMVSAAAAGMADTTQYMTAYGGIITQRSSSWKNVLSAGVERGAALVSQRLLERLAADPFFVRVPAGTTFYLYVTQTVDLAKATVAGSASLSPELSLVNSHKSEP